MVHHFNDFKRSLDQFLFRRLFIFTGILIGDIFLILGFGWFEVNYRIIFYDLLQIR